LDWIVALARTHLLVSDPQAVTRTWQMVMAATQKQQARLKSHPEQPAGYVANCEMIAATAQAGAQVLRKDNGAPLELEPFFAWLGSCLTSVRSRQVL